MSALDAMRKLKVGYLGIKVPDELTKIAIKFVYTPEGCY